MPHVVHIRQNIRGAIRIDRATKWGNPFVIGKHGSRDQVCDKYEKWFWQQPALVAALPELRGRDLECWCSPQRCHGDFLLREANKEPT